MATTISGSSGVTFPAGGVGNPAGAVVGTTDTQTLTNKTLGSGLVAGASYLTSGTSQASTSGTSIDFTGIPSWVKRVTVIFSGVSGSGTSPLLLQLGSTTIQTTGYLSFAMNGITSGATTVAGMLLTANQSAAGTHTGNIIVTNITSNSWVSSGVMQDMVNGNGSMFASSVSLAGVLDRVRITTINGTDTFDAGSINILYE